MFELLQAFSNQSSVVSINILRKIGSFSAQETHFVDSLDDNFLRKIMYSIVKFLNADPTLVFWGIFTEFNCSALTINNLTDTLNPEEKCCIYRVSVDGQENPYTIKIFQSFQCKDSSKPGATFIAEFSQESKIIGNVEIDFKIYSVFSGCGGIKINRR